MTATMTKIDAQAAAIDAARRIVNVISTFSPWVRINLAQALAAEKSATLRSIGCSLLGKDPVTTMATSLLADVFLGDLEDIAPELGDTEPWSTIREALEDVAKAWHLSRPGLRTRRDYAARALTWKQGVVQRAQDATVEPLRPRTRIVTRLCTRCGLPATSSRHQYCDDCRAWSLNRPGRSSRPRKYEPGKTKARGYTGKHAVLRKRWTPKVAAGGVACGRCGRLIEPGTPWDLGHPGDDKRLEPVPWHRRCNRQYAATVTKARRRSSR